MPSNVHLLETTLRDGSYEVDNQFTAQDTAVLVHALDQAGLRYLEVSQAYGYGADRWRTPFSSLRPGASDRAHLAAARAVKPQAKLGVLLAVGADFAPIECLQELPPQGVDFVRLAFFPEDVLAPSALAYVERAKALGLLVSVNLMQSSAVPPSKVAEASAAAARCGADWYYVVDSAGCLTPDQVQEYVRAIRDSSPLRVGVHTHNNRGLAMANCLAAIAAGATMVDGTLQGIGRATGNAPTEQLLLALQALGHETGVRREHVLQAGTLARALFAAKGNDPLYFVSGAARLHSRALPELCRAAERTGRSTAEVVARAGSEVTRLGLGCRGALPREVVDQACQDAPALLRPAPSTELAGMVAQGISTASRVDLPSLAEALFIRSRKRHKAGVLHLVRAADFPFARPLPWESADHAGVTVPVPVDVDVSTIDPARAPRVLLVDEPLAHRDDLPPLGWQRLEDSFPRLLAEITADLAALHAGGGPCILDVRDVEGEWIARRLAERRIQVSHRASGAGGRLFILRADALGSGLELEAGHTAIVLGTVTPALQPVVDRARARGARLLRPPLGPAIAARVAVLSALHRPLERRGALVDETVVPATGELVVDDPACPSSVVDAAGASIEDSAREAAAVRAASLLAGEGRL
ncbi:MAG TPA: hypothetical protein VND93_26615 [Myxococcales bacterium]|nr:hypothetical protein [Myxococcales bacterium]